MTRTIWCSAVGTRGREFERKPHAILVKVDPVDQFGPRLPLLQRASSDIAALEGPCNRYPEVTKPMAANNRSTGGRSAGSAAARELDQLRKKVKELTLRLQREAKARKLDSQLAAVAKKAREQLTREIRVLREQGRKLGSQLKSTLGDASKRERALQGARAKVGELKMELGRKTEDLRRKSGELKKLAEESAHRAAAIIRGDAEHAREPVGAEPGVPPALSELGSQSHVGEIRMEDPFRRPTFGSAVFYKDPFAALDWLEKAFGFARSMVITDKDGKLGHSEMKFGEGYIMVGSEWADFVASPSSVDGKNTQTIHVHLKEGIDAHCERARAAGAAIIREPADQFYGDRSYMAKDPEGHVWSFAQTVRHVSREEAEKASGLKIEGWP